MLNIAEIMLQYFKISENCIVYITFSSNENVFSVLNVKKQTSPLMHKEHIIIGLLHQTEFQYIKQCKPIIYNTT